MKGRMLILITCVIVLSFAGVGYSAWVEGLSIKSLFNTGNIHVVFKDPIIVNNELNEINAEADESVLDIYGAVAPGSTVVVEYDIYNDSSIPVKYHPDDEALPGGIILDQDDTVIQPGEYLRGNQLTIEPGENELILPFVQYNSSVRGGWKEELRICWNITVIEETVNPELDMMNENEKAEEAPIEDVPLAEEPIEEDADTELPETVTTPGVDPTPDIDPTDPEPENNPTAETQMDEAPSEDPANNENLNEVSTESEEDNTESDEGSVENVKDGEE